MEYGVRETKRNHTVLVELIEGGKEGCLVVVAINREVVILDGCTAADLLLPIDS